MIWRYGKACENGSEKKTSKVKRGYLGGFTESAILNRSETVWKMCNEAGEAEDYLPYVHSALKINKNHFVLPGNE